MLLKTCESMVLKTDISRICKSRLQFLWVDVSDGMGAGERNRAGPMGGVK